LKKWCGDGGLVVVVVAVVVVIAVGLYQSSALAPAEIRPFLQIRLKSGSGQNWAGFEILLDLENFHLLNNTNLNVFYMQN